MLYICADEIKKTLKGYTPSRAEFFHTKSAKLADKEFEESIKLNQFEKIILLCGGTASGKTEYAFSQFDKENIIVFDSTLSTKEGAGNKISKSLKIKRPVEIHFIIPEDLKRSFSAFLGRDRQFSPKYFYKTHFGCREALLYIYEKYASRIHIKIIESNYKPDETIYFTELIFNKIESQQAYIENIQISIEEIQNLVI